MVGLSLIENTCSRRVALLSDAFFGASFVHVGDPSWERDSRSFGCLMTSKRCAGVHTINVIYNHSKRSGGTSGRLYGSVGSRQGMTEGMMRTLCFRTHEWIDAENCFVVFLLSECEINGFEISAGSPLHRVAHQRQSVIDETAAMLMITNERAKLEITRVVCGFTPQCAKIGFLSNLKNQISRIAAYIRTRIGYAVMWRQAVRDSRNSAHATRLFITKVCEKREAEMVHVVCTYLVSKRVVVETIRGGGVIISANTAGSDTLTSLSNMCAEKIGCSLVFSKKSLEPSDYDLDWLGFNSEQKREYRIQTNSLHHTKRFMPTSIYDAVCAKQRLGIDASTDNVSPFVKPIVFTGNKRVKIIQAPQGGGKSHAVSNYFYSNATSFLMISCRRTLTSSFNRMARTLARTQRTPGAVHQIVRYDSPQRMYTDTPMLAYPTQDSARKARLELYSTIYSDDCDDREDNSHTPRMKELYEEEWLSIQLESLHKLISYDLQGMVTYRRYNRVIIDEFRGLCDQIASPTNRRNRESIDVLRQVLTRASEVIILDADILVDGLALEMIRMLGVAPSDITLKVYTYVRPTMRRSMSFTPDVDSVLRMVKHLVAKKKRLMIPCSTRTRAESIEKMLTGLCKVFLVTSETSLVDGDFMDNPTRYMQRNNVQVLVFTSRVSCGIDINCRFYKIIAFYEPCGPPMRDMFQMCGRARSVEIKEVTIATNARLDAPIRDSYDTELSAHKLKLENRSVRNKSTVASAVMYAISKYKMNEKREAGIEVASILEKLVSCNPLLRCIEAYKNFARAEHPVSSAGRLSAGGKRTISFDMDIVTLSESQEREKKKDVKAKRNARAFKCDENRMLIVDGMNLGTEALISALSLLRGNMSADDKKRKLYYGAILDLPVFYTTKIEERGQIVVDNIVNDNTLIDIIKEVASGGRVHMMQKLINIRSDEHGTLRKGEARRIVWNDALMHEGAMILCNSKEIHQGLVIVHSMILDIAGVSVCILDTRGESDYVYTRNVSHIIAGTWPDNLDSILNRNIPDSDESDGEDESTIKATARQIDAKKRKATKKRARRFGLDGYFTYSCMSDETLLRLIDDGREAIARFNGAGPKMKKCDKTLSRKLHLIFRYLMTQCGIGIKQKQFRIRGADTRETRYKLEVNNVVHGLAIEYTRDMNARKEKPE